MKTGMALVLTLAGLVAGRTWADDKPKEEKNTLEGTWTVTAAMAGDNNLEDFKNATFEFKGGKMTVQGGDQSREAKIKPDTSKTPHRLDVMVTKGPDEGMTYHAIFEVKGDKLMIAASVDGAAPSDFKPKEGVLLFTLKRKTV